MQAELFLAPSAVCPFPSFVCSLAPIQDQLEQTDRCWHAQLHIINKGKEQRIPPTQWHRGVQREIQPRSSWKFATFFASTFPTKLLDALQEKEVEELIKTSDGQICRHAALKIFFTESCSFISGNLQIYTTPGWHLDRTLVLSAGRPELDVSPHFFLSFWQIVYFSSAFF